MLVDLFSWSCVPDPGCLSTWSPDSAMFSTEWTRRPPRNWTPEMGGGAFSCSSSSAGTAALAAAGGGGAALLLLSCCCFLLFPLLFSFPSPGDTGALCFLLLGLAGLPGGEGGVKVGGASWSPAILPAARSLRRLSRPSSASASTSGPVGLEAAEIICFLDLVFSSAGAPSGGSLVPWSPCLAV